MLSMVRLYDLMLHSNIWMLTDYIEYRGAFGTTPIDRWYAAIAIKQLRPHEAYN